jgi:hypothetical protein
MYKLLFVFAMILAMALAAPQFLVPANTGKVLYEHGWTDGPNNGVGPAYINLAPITYSGLTHTVLV